MTDDPMLRGLLADRARLLKQLAHCLRRVGASHPNRSKVNALAATRRRAARVALRQNAELIAAHCMTRYHEATHADTRS